MNFDRWASVVRAALGLCVLWLAGCTSYVQTQVTAFSDWQGSDATRTYAFARTPDQQNSIEQTTYEALVANELAKNAFRQVPEASAHYRVELAYSIRNDLMTVRQPVYYDPWLMYGPYGRPYWGAIRRLGSVWPVGAGLCRPDVSGLLACAADSHHRPQHRARGL